MKVKILPVVSVKFLKKTAPLQITLGGPVGDHVRTQDVARITSTLDEVNDES